LENNPEKGTLQSQSQEQEQEQEQDNTLTAMQDDQVTSRAKRNALFKVRCSTTLSVDKLHVVGSRGWNMSTEHWWHDTDRGEWSNGGMIRTGESGGMVE
jgi:hypothetical protein